MSTLDGQQMDSLTSGAFSHNFAWKSTSGQYFLTSAILFKKKSLSQQFCFIPGELMSTLWTTLNKAADSTL